MRRVALVLLVLCIAGLTWVDGRCDTPANKRFPNVVLILADDLGYGDLSCYGATKIQTPNIDRLAREGKRFTDAHSASAVCSPSRYALLTGEYPLRANNGQGLWGPLGPTAGLVVDTNTLTIAKVFKNKGYATACIGKWHLGFKTGTNDWKEPLRPGPLELGFDYYFGIPVVNSSPPYVYVENDRIFGGDPADPLIYLSSRQRQQATPITNVPPEAGQRTPNRFKGAVEAHKMYNPYTSGAVLTEKALQWLEAHKHKPFFLYFATPHIHHPFTPGRRFQGASRCGLYGDFVLELDWMVGQILRFLDDNGLANDTLVIFTSDNGGMFNIVGQRAFVKYGHRINGELLGFKFGIWEGGHRVPFIVRWPGKVRPGTVSDQLICQVDLLATFMAVTGEDVRSVKDSINMLPAFLGEPDKPLRTELVIAPRQPTHLGIRRGKWMYIGAQGSGGFQGTKPGMHTFAGPAAASFIGHPNSDIENGKIKKDAPPAQLYDLQADLRQTTNLYRQYPQVVKELAALLDQYRPKQQTDNSGQQPPHKKAKD